MRELLHAKTSILEAIGHTPVVQLQPGRHAIGPSRLYAKLEYLNPGGSAKDRAALHVVNEAERTGKLLPGGTLVEATSGNTGAALAMVAAVRGYRCVFVVPETSSPERVGALRAWGAKVVVCPAVEDPEDSKGVHAVAQKLADETPKAFYVNQYHNPANPEAHEQSMGPELWEQCGASLDVLVGALGTGSTLTGTARYLKRHKPSLRVVGVEPVGSVYQSFWKTGALTKGFPSKVEGIGQGFVPTVLDTSLLDEVLRVDDREALLTTRELVRSQGLYCGGSSGAAVAGALQYARSSGREENIVVLLPDGAEGYLSTVFNDDWMREHGFLEAEPSLGTVKELLSVRGSRQVVTARLDDSVRHVIQTMTALGISQLPVLEGTTLRGIVAEVDVLRHLVTGEGHLDNTVASIVESDYATVSPDTRIEVLKGVLANAKVALVTEHSKLIGLVSKIDLIEYLSSIAGA